MLLDRQLLRQTRPHRLALVLTSVSGVLCAISIVVQAWFTADIISSIFLSGIPIGSTSKQLSMLVLAILCRVFFQFWNEAISARMGIDIQVSLRYAIIQKITRMGPVFASSEKSGELTTTLTDGVEALDPYFSQYIPQLILAAFIPLVISGSILPGDPLSFAILILTAPLLPVFMYLLGSMSEKSTRKQWQLLVKLGTHFYDTIQGLQLLKSINRSQSRGQEIQQNNEQYHHLTMSVLKLTFMSAFMLEFIATISTAVIAVEIGLRLLAGNLQFMNALFILLLAPEFYLPLRQLGLKFHAGMSGRAASIRIFQLLTMDEPFHHESDAGTVLPIEESEQDTENDLEQYFPIIFRNVNAKYPETKEYILKDISFQLNRFERIALVGKSGVGKSSLSYLLMQLLDISEGEICFGRQSIREIPHEELKNLISWVPQSPYLFSGSILENISLFQSQPDMTRVNQAAASAHLDAFIGQLPEGYQTQVGERGSLISTGQAQRLAIARAFYRDTPILVMDEPTSSVDPETEKDLIDSIASLQSKRTMLIIAHRLSTILTCDQIIFLDQGRIKEIGTHSDLLANRGGYYRLFHGFNNELD